MIIAPNVRMRIKKAFWVILVGWWVKLISSQISWPGLDPQNLQLIQWKERTNSGKFSSDPYMSIMAWTILPLLTHQTHMHILTCTYTNTLTKFVINSESAWLWLQLLLYNATVTHHYGRLCYELASPMLLKNIYQNLKHQ